MANAIIRQQASGSGGVTIYKLGSIEGSTTTTPTFDVKTLLPSIYTQLTADNFILKITSIYARDADDGANRQIGIVPLLNYNQTTGIITITDYHTTYYNLHVWFGNADIYVMY